VFEILQRHLNDVLFDLYVLAHALEDRNNLEVKFNETANVRDIVVPEVRSERVDAHLPDRFCVA